MIVACFLIHYHDNYTKLGNLCTHFLKTIISVQGNITDMSRSSVYFVHSSPLNCMIISLGMWVTVYWLSISFVVTHITCTNMFINMYRFSPHYQLENNRENFILILKYNIIGWQKKVRMIDKDKSHILQIKLCIIRFIKIIWFEYKII